MLAFIAAAIVSGASATAIACYWMAYHDDFFPAGSMLGGTLLLWVVATAMAAGYAISIGNK